MAIMSSSTRLAAVRLSKSSIKVLDAHSGAALPMPLATMSRYPIPAWTLRLNIDRYRTLRLDILEAVVGVGLRRRRRYAFNVRRSTKTLTDVAIRVLIVDDSAAVRGTLEEVLRTLLGFEVAGTATKEEEVISVLEKEVREVDLVILDLLLETGSGFNILARYAKGEFAVPIVVYSGFITPVIAQRCLSFGAAGAFQKSDSAGLMGFLERYSTRVSKDPPE
jgi:CheY-like chemotaxis protein